jgi:hypothetical protein
MTTIVSFHRGTKRPAIARAAGGRGSSAEIVIFPSMRSPRSVTVEQPITKGPAPLERDRLDISD